MEQDIHKRWMSRGLGSARDGKAAQSWRQRMSWFLQSHDHGSRLLKRSRMDANECDQLGKMVQTGWQYSARAWLKALGGSEC